MPSLDWVGRKAVENHHKEVPFHLLRCNGIFSFGNPDSGNLLVQGDNLLALKALLPYYAGKVKCIYIDPPYNTGEENWRYNDNVNSPEIRKWLGDVVGSEAVDLSRHDKWLCMMYPRLNILRELLSEDGGIFISIDDNEVPNLRTLLNEVFGVRNFVASVIWQKRTSPEARLVLGPAHDYVVVYAKSLEHFKNSLHLIPLSGERAKEYKNPDNDPRGRWASVDLTGQTGHATPSQYWELVTPFGRRLRPPAGRCWAIAEGTFKELVKDNRIWFGKKGNARPRLKKFLSETEGMTTWTWWPNNEVGHNQEATKELKDILGVADAFENPKPTRLIKRILQLSTAKDSLILDSFVGSGTTGQAVLQINKDDGGNRRFILIEIEQEICQQVTAVRLKRVIEGYNNTEGLGGGFRYCTLGPTLFDAEGRIRGEVSFDELAHHVFFVETGEPLPKRVNGKTPFLGVSKGLAVYLLYNGILGDKSVDGGNVLTRSVLVSLLPHEGPRVIYGTSCRLGAERLRREGITFKQIPYAIRVD